MKREIFYRSGINPGSNNFGTHWERIEGKLTQVVVGDGKIMGINDSLVYYRTGMSEDEEYGTHWNPTGWHASYMSISKNLIAIIREHQVMLRVGINKTSPLGTEWIYLEGNQLFKKVGLFEKISVPSEMPTFYEERKLSQAMGTCVKKKE